MEFSMEEAVELLERTPKTLESLLSGLSVNWLQCKEGEGTWNVREVVEHVIECEKTNWIPRLKHILQQGDSSPFPSFDRYAHLRREPERDIHQILHELKEIRAANTAELKALVQPERHLELTGLHPALGRLKISELIAAWVVHDFTHMAQIVRVMAKRYEREVGPMIAYLGVLKP